MAEKNLYYGGKGKNPLYYGGGSSSYGGRSPMYYGSGRRYGGTYGKASYYGAYGGENGESNSDGSVIGTLSVKRILRVFAQRWLSIFVFLLIGVVISFAVYRISPTIYEASSEFMMDMRRASGRGSSLGRAMQDYGNDYAEIFNTRSRAWRSNKIVTMIVQEYRAGHPASTVADDEIMQAIGGSRLEIQRGSRIIMISVKSKSPQLAAGVANAYAKAIESYTDEENKMLCDKAVSQIHLNAEKKRREVETLAKELLDFRTAHKVDNLRSARDTARQALSQTNSEILRLESEETQLIEWEKMLSEVQKKPESYGSLSTGIPRAQEIATEYKTFLTAKTEYEKLLVIYTDSHPEVKTKKSELDVARQGFLDAAARALQTGRSNLRVTQNRLSQLRVKRDDLTNELSSLAQRVVLAESGLGILETNFGVANRIHEGLVLDENKARLEAQANQEVIVLGRQATVPTVPVAPNPMYIFGIGIAGSLALGILFVLVLDNLEDTVVNLSDIEQRLSLKVLAVLPHVRRKRREQVARFILEDKFSQFAETVAGLRNLLDSPRYESMTQCMLVISTQPGEGKTITSTSLAITYAQVGRKVLHVDFDMRRPRLARVWNLSLTPDRSFSHVLGASGGNKIDFAKLVNKTDIPSLDVIASLPPQDLSPATIFGSAAVASFFEWARANYDNIIIDSPPYGLVGDVVSLAVQVDSVLIMCCPDRTHFRPIQYCARGLTEAGANILGVVVNDVDVSGASAFAPNVRHSYGYGYGYGYGRSVYGYRDKPVEEGDGRENKPEEKPQDADEFTDDE